MSIDFARHPTDEKLHSANRLCERPFPGSELLTRREYEVVVQITGGASNKEIGRFLGISVRTVEVHRAHIMHKLHARNAADLVRIVLSQVATDLSPPPVTRAQKNMLDFLRRAGNAIRGIPRNV
jgi:DNA-binding CsgD family transcriptional regulator